MNVLDVGSMSVKDREGETRTEWVFCETVAENELVDVKAEHDFSNFMFRRRI